MKRIRIRVVIGCAGVVRRVEQLQRRFGQRLVRARARPVAMTIRAAIYGNGRARLIANAATGRDNAAAPAVAARNSAASRPHAGVDFTRLPAASLRFASALSMLASDIARAVASSISTGTNADVITATHASGPAGTILAVPT